MSTALARADQSAEMVERLDFSDEQKRLIREAYAPGASDLEFSVLLETAKALGLNPLMKQIHFVNRYDNQKERNVWSCQTGIDGFRSIADDTGKYDGQDKPEFEYNADGELILARTCVYRKDIGRAFVGEARWDEFVQTKKNGDPTHMWRKMPHTMLAKCSESQALRKAFPRRLGGLYSDEEMMQSENDREAAAPKRVQKPAPPQITMRQGAPTQPASPIADAEFEPSKFAATPPARQASPPIDPAEKALADDLARRAATAEPKDLEALLDQAKRLPVRVLGVGISAVVARHLALATTPAEVTEFEAWAFGIGMKKEWLAPRVERRRAEIQADIEHAAMVDKGAA